MVCLALTAKLISRRTSLHVLTVAVPNEFLAKLGLIDKDLSEYSRETVQMFFKDAAASAYEIKTTRFAAE